MRLCTLVTSACVVGRILLSLRRQRVRKRGSGRKGKRGKERRLRKIFWEKGRERDTVGEREREREKERRVRTKNCGRKGERGG